MKFFLLLLGLLLAMLCSATSLIAEEAGEEDEIYSFFMPSSSVPSPSYSKDELIFLSEARVAEINKSQKQWTAKVNPRFAAMTPEQFRYLLGVRPEQAPLLKQSTMAANSGSIPRFEGPMPEHFDAREQWPQCADVIGQIQDQSACGSCWAVSSASVMQDRICVASEGKVKVNISAIDIASCDGSCYGCLGGWPHHAFLFWQKTGVCTGSNFTLAQGCKPYPFPPHARKFYMEPRCQRRCSNIRYKPMYSRDKSYGQEPVTLEEASQQQIQAAIMQGGSVATIFVVYDDFMHYHAGIYAHGNESSEVGLHAVRIIGWGQQQEQNGTATTPFWLIANSWNADWGDNGYFRIIRGQDECGIESRGITFAKPNFEKKSATEDEEDDTIGIASA